jgi:putative effector of murein hydrolase LrgA (UPF0299 family)
MQFFGLFTLVVLPLFLWVCILIIRNNDNLKNNGFGIFLEILFSVFIILSVVGITVLLFNI